MELGQPLNKAHFAQRQAERQILKGDFHQALDNFKTAAEFFDIAVSRFTTSCSCSCYNKSAYKTAAGVAKNSSLTNSSINASQVDINNSGQFCCCRNVEDFQAACQTLLEQRKFCFRQAEILALKLLQLKQSPKQQQQQHKTTETIVMAAANISTNNLQSNNSNAKTASENLFDYNLSNLDVGKTIEPTTIAGMKSEVFRKFDRHDSLLDELGLATSGNDNSEQKRRQKSDKDLIEELKRCNEELRCFILQLFELLEQKAKQLEELHSSCGAAITTTKMQSEEIFMSSKETDEQQQQHNVINQQQNVVAPILQDNDFNIVLEDTVENDPIFDFAPLELPEYKPPELP